MPEWAGWHDRLALRGAARLHQPHMRSPLRSEAPDNRAALADALGLVQSALEGVDYRLAVADLPDRIAHRARLLREIVEHRARLAHLDAPLLVVFGGVTGAGKSTVTNTLAGRQVVATGVVRPTTSGATLLARSEDIGWFRDGRVLPGLTRLESEGGPEIIGDPHTLVLVAAEELPPGLAIIDAPDIDSVRDANRDLADRLLDAADVWLWFTTAGKYADQESMAYIRRADERRTTLRIALTQVRHEHTDAIVSDLSAKLETERIEASIDVIAYENVEEGRLPYDAIAQLRAWLWTYAEPGTRLRARLRTLRGAMNALPGELDLVEQSLRHDLEEVRELATEVERAYLVAREEFVRAMDAGLPLQKEILTRWNGFVGGGRLLKLADAATGQARVWIRSLTGPLDDAADDQRVTREMQGEIRETLVELTVDLAGIAASTVIESWSRTPAGRELATDPSLRRATDDIADRARDMVEGWQAHVVDLVATRGEEKRVRARWVSSVINAAATGAIVVALAHTGGLTGAEAGIATAAGAANQTLLVKMLGAQNLKWLVTSAREDLQARFGDLLRDERRRYSDRLAAVVPDPRELDRLATARQAVADAG